MYERALPDRRLAERAEQLQAALAQHQSVSVAGVAEDRAEQVGFYRLLSNPRVTEARLIEGLAQGALAALERSPDEVHLLAIQDTTQLNFEAHRRRLRPESGLGVLGDARSTGFFLHPTLLVEAGELRALGFSEVRQWSRDPQRPDKHGRGYRTQPLEEKESARWVESPQQSRLRLGAAVHLTSIADREGDLYPLFARVPGPHTDLLVRLCRDHRIEEAPGGLYAYLAAQPLSGTEEIEVRGDVRKRRSARRARVTYRLAQVHLRRPPRWKAEAPGTGPLWAVEVREVPETVPAGEEALHWRLLTTHRVEDLAQARRAVLWYRQRWYIEQIFRLLKLEGLDLESSELETGTGLRRLALFALGAALDVLRLLLAERGESTQPLEQVFTPSQQQCLTALGAKVEGRTQKLQNPHPPHTLAWAAWVIARLGGWKGYRSQRPAGPLTYRRGLMRFVLLCEGFHLAANVPCTP